MLTPRAVRSKFTYLAHRGSPEQSRSAFAEVSAWANQQRRTIHVEMAARAEDYRRLYESWHSLASPYEEPKRLYYQSTAARAMFVGGSFFLVMEAAISVGLMRLFTTLSMLWSTVIGVAIAAGLAFAAKGIFSVLLARYEDTPKAARDKLVSLLVALGTTEGLLLLFVFVLRGSDGDLLVRFAWLFGPVLSVLGLTTPVLSGLLLVGSSLFGWSHRMTSEWERLRDLDDHVTSLLHASDRGLTDLRHGEAVAIAPRLATVILVISMMPGVANAQPVHGIFIDRSGSVTETERLQGVTAVAEALPHLTERRQTHYRRIVGDAGG